MGIDAAQRHLGLVIAQGAGRLHLPILESLKRAGEGFVAELYGWLCQLMRFAPLLREAFGQTLTQEVVELCFCTPVRIEPVNDGRIRQQVDVDRVLGRTVLPVGGNL